MARFSTTTTFDFKCPKCAGDRVVKISFQRGVQRYRYKDCRKAFRANGKAEGRRMDTEMMGSAIRDFYTGKSYKQIAEGLKEDYDIPEPSKSTIYEWVRDYTDDAKELTAGMKAQVGDEWVADEMAVKVGSWQMWNWNVMDTKTRYILAPHLSRTRTKEAGIKTMEKAKAAAGKDPKTIKTDKLTSYRPAITKVFPDTLHIKAQGLPSSLNNNMSERLQGTYRSRGKTLRGLDSVETGQRYLDGWPITYNHMRGHESLNNDTLGKRAKANPPFAEWADVVKGDAVSPQLVTAETRLASVPQLKSDAKPELKREPSQRSKRESVRHDAAPLETSSDGKAIEGNDEGQGAVSETASCIQVAPANTTGATGRTAMIVWYWPLCGLAIRVSIIAHILLALLGWLNQWRLQTMKLVEGHHCGQTQLTLPPTPILVRLLLRTPKALPRTYPIAPPSEEPAATPLTDSGSS